MDYKMKQTGDMVGIGRGINQAPPPETAIENCESLATRRFMGINAALGELESQLDYLEKTIYNALCPVVQDKPLEHNKPPQPINSPLVTELDSIHTKIDAAISRIMTLRGRVEL